MKIVLTTIIVFISSFTYSQKWEIGYYYDLHGEKFEGQIKLHRDRTPCELSYRGQGIKKMKMTPDKFIAFCTEKDSFTVLKDVFIGGKKEETIPFNYYKVIGGNPIYGYIMYLNDGTTWGPSYNTGAIIVLYGEKEFKGIYLVSKGPSGLIPVYDDKSMNALLGMVKDDQEVYDYLVKTGYNASLIKNAINLYNRRNGG